MQTINIGTKIAAVDARQVLDLNDASMRRWGTVREKHTTPASPESIERKAAETIIAAYRSFAIDRLMEVVHLRCQRRALPRWRWLADIVLARRQAKALAHARRHLANIATAEQVRALLPN